MIGLSVVIPCYEMNGLGVQFLNQTLLSLVDQTFKNFEVIITDHSVDDNIKNFCECYDKDLLIKYFKNDNKRGSSSANVNLGIKKSCGKIIKILCQDDYLFGKDSLIKTYNSFNTNVNWLVSDYIHTHDGVNYQDIHRAKWNDNIQLLNSIGTHSCLSFVNDNPLLFDENLVWFMDCELYKRLSLRYGLPFILNEITIVNRIWKGSVTNTLATQHVRRKEYLYLKKKYGD